MWFVPQLNDECRQLMEDVLTLYEPPHDPAEPVICLDKQPQQLLDDTRPSEPCAPGQTAKQDYEYRSSGTGSAFLAIEPKAGRRHIWVRRRAKPDFARVVRDLLKRIEWYFTPKHASWHNMAEIELSVLTQQCRSRRMSKLAPLKWETAAWPSR